VASLHHAGSSPPSPAKAWLLSALSSPAEVPSGRSARFAEPRASDPLVTLRTYQPSASAPGLHMLKVNSVTVRFSAVSSRPARRPASSAEGVAIGEASWAEATRNEVAATAAPMERAPNVLRERWLCAAINLLLGLLRPSSEMSPAKLPARHAPLGKRLAEGSSRCSCMTTPRRHNSAWYRIFHWPVSRLCQHRDWSPPGWTIAQHSWSPT